MSKSVGAKWCILRDSEKLRSTIEFKIRQYKLTNARLGEITGIDRNRISKWRNRYRCHLTQHQLVKIADALGIEVDLNIIIKE